MRSLRTLHDGAICHVTSKIDHDDLSLLEPHSLLDKAGQRRQLIGNHAVDKAQFRKGVEQRAWAERACGGGGGYS
ncbi:MAG: hypothetical protein LBL45_01030 [Treponema sp.]|nr:hypothetical protein [Treponema sp.]